MLIWLGVFLAVVVLVVFVGIQFALHSNSVRRLILTKAQQRATQALGSEVTVTNYGLSFSGISPTLDLYNVAIAGADPYRQPSLLQVDHVRVGVRIVSVLQKKWYLSEVTVNHPVVRVFVDKQGKNNLPKPKSTGQKSNTNLFDMAVQHARLDRGEVYYNDRKSALDADLHNVDFQSNFDNLARKYSGRLSYSDGHLKMENFNPIPHDLVAYFDLTPQDVNLRNTVLRSGSSQVTVNATLSDYSGDQPKLQGDYEAQLDTGEFRRILKNPAVPAGMVAVNGTVNYVQQPNRQLLDTLSAKGRLTSKLLKVIQPAFQGDIRNIGMSYSLENGNANLRNIRANVLGGDVNGEMTMRNLTGGSKSHLTVNVKNISLAQAKTMIKSPALKQVGVTGTVSADADATWGKTLDNLAATANATVDSRILPAQAKGQAVPVNGVVHAQYSAPKKQITLTNSYVNLPQTSLNLNGTVSDRSSLRVQLQAKDLHELESMAAMFQANPQPLGLQGAASFNGNVTGSTAAPRVTGRLMASDLHVKGSSWRVLRTDVDLSPSQAVLQNGELAPAARGNIGFDLRAGLTNWAFTKDSTFQVKLNGNQLDVANLAKTAGVKAPVMGTLNLNVQARGTQLNPTGNGRIDLQQAVISGEPVRSASVNFEGTGDAVHAVLAVRLPAGAANGNVDYFPKQQGYNVQIQANGIQLDQLQTVKQKNLKLTGVLNLNASGKGTFQDPQLIASAEIPSLVVQDQKIEGVRLQANVANHVANVNLDSQALNTNLQGRATVNLSGDYQTVASLNTQAIPFAPLVAIYAPAQAGNITGQTEIHASLRGPLKKTAALDAHITIPTFQVNYKNTVQIGAPQPIQIDFANGVLELQKSALRGTGTDLQFQGRVPVVDRSQPMSLLMQGTVDLKVAQLLNPDLATSGQLVFDINSYIHGSNPNVEGQIRVVNAGFATADAPLGLQNGNGVLTLTASRLDVTRFEGTVGGGRIIARGGVIYRPDIAFDLALVAQNIRLLYPEGLRSGIAGNITLAGRPTAAVLRGQVNLQQLSFAPNFDLTEFAGQFGESVSAPPTESFADNLQLQLNVTAPNGIDAISRELRLAGGLNLNVRGTAAEPVVLGRVNVTDGDLIFRGNRYLLQGATIDFVNPNRTQPVLNATVNTRVDQYDIAMRFEGPIDRLRTNYTSDPALPPADIINLLVFGKTMEAEAANPNPPGRLGAESAIASAVAGQVTSRLAKVAGISQLSVNPTLGGTGSGGQTDPGANITVQQRVTSKIFVTFSTDVTSTERQVMQLQYQATPRFSVSGTRDQNGGFAVDTQINKKW